MAPRVYYRSPAGATVEITDYIDRRQPWTLTEKAEEGAVGSSTLIVNDPGMTLEFDGHRRLWVVEDDSEATDDVLFGGFVADQVVSRGQGDHFEPLGRVWTLSVVDGNSIWNRRVMTGSDCKRPAETDVERVEWVLSSAESGIFDDVTTYVSAANAQNMDKGDLRRQYRDQIMGDCAEHAQKNWWAQYQETGAGREWVAWYGKDNLTTYSSSLWLSNDPADWSDAELLDGSSLVWPYSEDAEVTRDPSRVYSGVLVEHERGWVYRKNATTASTYASRDYIAPSRNIKTKATAIGRATRLLAKLDTQDVRIKLTVVLPKGKASMIRAGMRIPFKATHVPDLDDQFYWCRVLSCAVTPEESGNRYALALELAPTGTAAGADGPYTGSVFAALLHSDDAGPGTDLFFSGTGDAPPGGWFEEPTVGPITIDQGALPFLSVTVSRHMTVRVEAIVYGVGVGGPPITVTVTASGREIGSETFTPPGGFWGHFWTIDVSNVILASGETVTVGGDIQGIWTNLGNNATYLRVGRGTHVWNNGLTTWVGP